MRLGLLIPRGPFRLSWRVAPAVILAIGFVALNAWKPPVVVWLVFLAASLHQARGGKLGGPIGPGVQGALRVAPASILGEASYSTYLVHFPLLQIAMYFAVRVFALSPMAAVVFVAAATLISTYAVSRVTWRFIELPFIAYGRRRRGEDVSSASPSMSSP